jgi:ubiquinone/menaquinone biosynthesis C-methylase UbiE
MSDVPPSWWLDELAHAGREHLDELHSRRYDAKMDAQAAAEVDALAATGVLVPGSTVVDLGAGSGQFALAAAEVCGRVVAVDVSPVMLERLLEKRERTGVRNVEVVCAGFLSYEHRGEPVHLVYSRFALHHLPDFWKALALRRIAGLLRPGGALRLADVVYSFDTFEAESRIDAWIEQSLSIDVERGWTREELAEHVRDEYSTFTWLLEPMIDRAGFDLREASYDPSGMFASYLCIRR